jgi:hypothetical protein
MVDGRVAMLEKFRKRFDRTSRFDGIQRAIRFLTEIELEHFKACTYGGEDFERCITQAWECRGDTSFMVEALLICALVGNVPESIYMINVANRLSYLPKDMADNIYDNAGYHKIYLGIVDDLVFGTMDVSVYYNA